LRRGRRRALHQGVATATAPARTDGPIPRTPTLYPTEQLDRDWQATEGVPGTAIIDTSRKNGVSATPSAERQSESQPLRRRGGASSDTRRAIRKERGGTVLTRSSTATSRDEPRSDR
jgi:hypothetical protein